MYLTKDDEKKIKCVLIVIVITSTIYGALFLSFSKDDSRNNMCQDTLFIDWAHTTAIV